MGIRDLHHALAHSLEPWTFDQLLALASRKAIARAVGEGSIVRLLPNRYSSALHAGSWEVRSRAAAAWAGPDALLGGLSALWAWGAADVPVDVALSVPWETRPRGPGWLRIRRHVTMPEARCTRGGRFTVPAELAVIQAHGALPAGRRAEALYRPLRQGLVSVESMADAIGAIPRFRGRRDLIRRVAAAKDGAESYLEEEGGQRILVGPAFREIVRQHWVAVGAERFRLDAFDARTLTAIEFDGEGTHGSAEARRADKARDAMLATVGVLTLRFEYADVMGRPLWCRQVAARTLRARAEEAARLRAAAPREY